MREKKHLNHFDFELIACFICFALSQTIVPRGQERPRVLVERNRTENRHARTRRDLQFDEGRGSDLEGTSLTTSPPDSRSSSRLSYRIPSSTPINPPVSCTVDTERQFLQLQRQIATLTEKIDSLKESANLANHQRANTRREENLPKDMVVSTVIFQVAWQFQRNLTSHRKSCPQSPHFSGQHQQH